VWQHHKAGMLTKAQEQELNADIGTLTQSGIPLVVQMGALRAVLAKKHSHEAIQNSPYQKLFTNYGILATIEKMHKSYEKYTSPARVLHPHYQKTEHERNRDESLRHIQKILDDKINQVKAAIQSKMNVGAIAEITGSEIDKTTLLADLFPDKRGAIFTAVTANANHFCTLTNNSTPQEVAVLLAALQLVDDAVMLTRLMNVTQHKNLVEGVVNLLIAGDPHVMRYLSHYYKNLKIDVMTIVVNALINADGKNHIPDAFNLSSFIKTYLQAFPSANAYEEILSALGKQLTKANFPIVLGLMRDLQSELLTQQASDLEGMDRNLLDRDLQPVQRALYELVRSFPEKHPDIIAYFMELPANNALHHTLKLLDIVPELKQQYSALQAQSSRSQRWAAASAVPPPLFKPDQAPQELPAGKQHKRHSSS